MSRALRALLASGLLAGCLAAAPARAVAGALTLTPCQITHPLRLTVVAADCGVLEVAENPAAPDGRHIGLHVARVAAINRRKQADALFVLAGGPGQAAGDFYASVAPAFGRIHRDRDIVLLDQRGTGASHALSCPGAQAQLYQASDAEVGAFAQHIYQDGAPFLSRNNGAFGVHMTWTMFEFGKRRSQVSERASEIAQAEENLARLKNRVRIDVEKAVRKLNRAETGVNSARELVASTTELRRVSSDQAEVGTANRSVLLESEASMFSAQADLLRAEYDRSVAAADLARLTGNR